jgi:hypothetical protein
MLMAWPEVGVAVGVLGTAGGVLFGYFKLGVDNASKRQARYRFAKEFFADVDVNCEMTPLQLEIGYEALGGPRRRPAGEIRHVLELSRVTPGIVDVHGRAALHHVQFSPHLGHFDWSGMLARRGARSSLEIACTVWYVIGPVCGLSLLRLMLDRGVSVSMWEFWVAAALLTVYFGFTAFLALLYVFKIGESASLVRSSKGEVAAPWRIPRAWQWVRRVVARMSVSLRGLPRGKRAPRTGNHAPFSPRAARH